MSDGLSTSESCAAALELCTNPRRRLALVSVFLDAVSCDGPSSVWVPHKLYPRRLLLGGHSLPSEGMVRELLRSTCQRWPGRMLA